LKKKQEEENKKKNTQDDEDEDSDENDDEDSDKDKDDDDENDDSDEEDDEDSDNGHKKEKQPVSDTKQIVGGNTQSPGSSTNKQNCTLSFTISPEIIADAFSSYGFKNITYFKQNAHDFRKVVCVEYDGDNVPLDITGKSLSVIPSLKKSDPPPRSSFGGGGRGSFGGGRGSFGGGRGRSPRGGGRFGNKFQRTPSTGQSRENEVYVGGLPSTYSQDDVRKVLGSYGSISNVKIKTKPDGTLMNYCFVQFEEPSSVSMAVSAGNTGSCKIGESTLKVSKGHT